MCLCCVINLDQQMIMSAISKVTHDRMHNGTHE